MRSLPDALAAHLAEGVTTLCQCWRITRRDGLVLGFTDHDRDLVAEGTAFVAAAAISGSESALAAGLAVTGTELSGALSDAAITEADLAAGLYDGAGVEVFLVNWAEPSQTLLLRRGSIGEVRAEDGAFVAEIRSVADALNQTRGRLFTATCDADLGDSRCGVDLDDPALRAEASVSAVDGALRLRLAGLDGFEDGHFTRGRLVFTGGLNAGFASEVKSHRREDGAVVVRLWQRPPLAVAEGDGCVLTAGCDKLFPTCAARFANSRNFRGFPHIPGNDFLITVAVPGEGGHDGSLIR